MTGGYFFAVRGCEHSKAPKPGKTKMLDLGSLHFRTASKQTVPHTDPDLIARSTYVTVTFRDQKNGDKMDSRTQVKTGDPVLCPILRLGGAVKRIMNTVPNFNDRTPLCTVRLNGKNKLITEDFTLKLLRSTCKLFGGKETFGFDSHEIGNKSLRSGAAMALFLMDHSPARIMILGRWSSDAFLVYIRPQVLEWTNNMSRDMIATDSFTDLTVDRTSNDDPRRRVTQRRSFNGRDSVVTIPPFHLYH